MSRRLDDVDYFLAVAQAAALRGTCPRRQVGAVLVCKRRIVATGYNGSLSGQPHCDEAGCLMHDNRCIRTTHAEVNAMRGEGDAFYTTDQPCFSCLKAILAGGVKVIHYIRPYPDEARDLFVAEHKLGDYIIKRRRPLMLRLDWEMPTADLTSYNVERHAVRVYDPHLYEFRRGFE